MRRLGILEGQWSSQGIEGFVWGILGVSFNFSRVPRPCVILGWSLFALHHEEIFSAAC